jgi:hypothetical protein
MPFVDKKGAMKLLKEIENGKCAGECRSIWMRNIKYALKTETNPLKLTKTEREKMLKMIEKISGKKSKKKEKSGKKSKKKEKSGKKLTLKKYRNRKSPPYPANDYCNKRKKGNDGLMYISKPNKNKVCSWKKV